MMIDYYKNFSNYYINKLAYPLLCCLFFVLPFGNLAEFDWFPFIGAKSKLQSMLGVIYISLGLASGLIFKGLFKYPSALFFIGFILIHITSITTNLGISDSSNITKQIIYPFYLIFIFLISAGLKINKKKILTILLIFLTSVFFTTLLSILDFWGIINFNSINTNPSYTILFGYEFRCMSGFFSTRTSFAFLISIALAITLFFLQVRLRKNITDFNFNCNLFFVLPVELTFKLSEIKEKYYYTLFSLIFILLLYAGLATNQRAFLIILSLTLLIPLYIKFKKNFIKLLTIAIFLLFVCIVLIISTGDVLQLGLDSSTLRIRLNAYLYTFSTILSNPIGTGYGLVEDVKYSMINPHNSYLYIIVLSGIYSFILYCLFLFPLIKSFFYLEKNDEDKYLFLIIFCWFFSQFFHNTMNSTFGWCFMGILASYLNTYKFKLKF